MKKIAITIGCVGFIVGVLSACPYSEPNPEHCVNASGDETCEELYGDARPFCTSDACDAESSEFHGCVAERPADDCYYPCGELPFTDDNSCVEVADDTTETDTDTGTESTETSEETGPDPCMNHDDCPDAATPFCDDASGECVACDGLDDPDAGCAEVDASAPLCVDGSCVQCSAEDDSACIETTPICDVDTNTCVPCSSHEQCPDSACNLTEGNCFDLESVVHVDGDNPCDMGDGTEAEPYCSISDALSASGAESVILLHEQDVLDYSESTTIAKPVAIFAAAGEQPTIDGLGGAPAFSVMGNGQLFARGLSIVNIGSNGILVNSGSAWIDDSLIEGSGEVGIRAGSAVVVRGTRILNNTAGGVVVDGGSLLLENCFVGGNQNQRIIDVVDGSVDVVYSTIGSGFGSTSRAIACANGAEVLVRNSVVVSYSDQPEIECEGATVEDSFTEDGSGMSFDDLSNWFVEFEAGDFHLAPAHPDEIDSAASWTVGDPASDIDGDARPTDDGSPDFAGADRIP